MDLDAIIIGAGHAGLSMSRCLYERGITHMVLERGRIAERWRSECWDSLRLLTPNSFARLPGRAYQGNAPDGFMPVSEWVSFLEEYACSFNAPILTGTNVDFVERAGQGLQVTAGSDSWRVRALVIATGYCSEPFIPQYAQELPQDILQLYPSCYRSPEQLVEGGVLVVGCGASGVQIAEELVRSGRKVILSVGRHRRLPRVYRGHDILWWSEKIGLFNQRTDPAISSKIPAPQLVGSDEKRSVDLGILQDMGVRLAGHVAAITGSCVFFHSDLKKSIADADADMVSHLNKVDCYADRHHMGGDKAIPAPISPLNTPSSVDLRDESIRTVIWATGYRRTYPWLKLDILDENGELIHSAGVTKEPGVYVLGLRRQIRYNSNFIDGAGEDARDLADHLANFLEHL
jgi:putative flavoprotein involved in K+ transport